MNKTYTFLIGLLFAFNSGFSQNYEKEPQNVVVDWKVGESKTISQVDSTVIYNNDSVFMVTSVSSNFKMKIVSLKDTVYEVLFKQVNIDNNISVGSEMIDVPPIQKMVQKLLVDLQKEMSGFEYSFLVSKNTALAYEVKNKAEMKRKIEELVVIVLNQYFDISKIEMDETEKKEIQLKVKGYMNEQMPAAFQTMLNSFNYIFQAYSIPFVLDETYISELDVYNVNQIKHGDDENRARMIVNSNMDDYEIDIDYKYVYDKKTTYQKYIAEQGKGDQISIEEFDLKERVESSFDVGSSWIKTNDSFVNVKMGMIEVNKTTHLIVK